MGYMVISTFKDSQRSSAVLLPFVLDIHFRTWIPLASRGARPERAVLGAFADVLGPFWTVCGLVGHFGLVFESLLDHLGGIWPHLGVILVVFGAPRRPQEGPRRPKRPQRAPQEGPKVVPRGCDNTIRDECRIFAKSRPCQ